MTDLPNADRGDPWPGRPEHEDSWIETVLILGTIALFIVVGGLLP